MMNKEVALAAGALALALATTAPVAMGQDRPAAAASQEVATEGVVMEVQGQRIKVRTADGRMQWYSVDVSVSQNAVGQRVRGVVGQAGDTLRLSSTTFSSQ
jgi:predicted outer membrane protein